MKIKVIPSAKIDAQQWDAFIEDSPQGMTYSLFDYLSSVCSSWEAIIVYQGDQWHAVLPIERKKKYLVRYAFQPKFTQFNGVCFRNREGKLSTELEWKKKVLTILIAKLKKRVRKFDLHMSPALNYTLPFHWANLEVSPRFTYQVDLPSKSNDDLFAQMGESTRRAIRKAEAQELTHEISNDITTIIDIFRSGVGRQLDLQDGDYELYGKLLPKLFDRNRAKGHILKSGKTVIAGIVTYQFNGVYTYFFGTADKSYSGAMSLLLWKAMLDAKKTGFKIFDFEGSMVESIEKFFRGFGGYPKTYFRVKK